MNDKRLNRLQYKETSNSVCPPHLTDVLIVGSAPSVNRFIDRIRDFCGPRWALNDAWFWLEKNNMEVHTAFITDTRFLRKSAAKIATALCKNIVVIDDVDLSPLAGMDKTIYSYKSLGRDGFSIKGGEIFHGCSVFFTALQTAFACGFKEVSICGVLFSPPGVYQRIDNSVNMPEYIFPSQMKNARLAMRTLSKFDIALKIFEPESNLNFL